MEKEGTMREKNERIGIKVPYTTFLSSRRNDVSGKKMGCRARQSHGISWGLFSSLGSPGFEEMVPNADSGLCSPYVVSQVFLIPGFLLKSLTPECKMTHHLISLLQNKHQSPNRKPAM